MQNPFQYGKVVSDPYFTDREAELQNIIQEVLSQHNLVLYSPRRYGKTSLLQKVAVCMKERGFSVLYIDFYQVTSRQSFIELYTREIFTSYGAKWRTALRKISALAKGIRPSVAFDTWGNPTFSLGFDNSANLPQTLESVLNLTETLDAKKQWLIIFDEFQEVTKLNGDSFENNLRSVIQHHTRSTYIFSGSRFHLLLDIFNKPERAFYRFGKIMQLEKIESGLMKKFILERFLSTQIAIPEAIAESIIDITDNIPNYVQFLAAEVWRQAYQNSATPDEGLLNFALENMLDNLKDFFLQIWEGLSLQQKRVLVALSKENTHMFSQEYHNRHHLGSISSSQRAVQKMIAEQLIINNAGVYEFGDPLFKRFIQLRISALRTFA